MTRAEFEKIEPIPHHDGMPYIPGAEKDCRVCRGMGIVDDGNQYAATFSRCSSCWTSKAEPRTKAGSLD